MGKIVSDYFYLKYAAESNLVSMQDFRVLKEEAEVKAFELVSNDNIELYNSLERFCAVSNLICFDRFSTVCSLAKRKCAVFTSDGKKIRYDYGHLTKSGKGYMADKLIELDFLSYLKEASEQ